MCPFSKTAFLRQYTALGQMKNLCIGFQNVNEDQMSVRYSHLTQWIVHWLQIDWVEHQFC